jgi:hypothetical protein
MHPSLLRAKTLVRDLSPQTITSDSDQPSKGTIIRRKEVQRSITSPVVSKPIMAPDPVPEKKKDITLLSMSASPLLSRRKLASNIEPISLIPTPKPNTSTK